jgi:hypothetical protein
MRDYLLKSVCVILICLLEGCQSRQFDMRTKELELYGNDTATAEVNANEGTPALDLTAEIPRIVDAGNAVPIQVIFTNVGGSTVNWLLTSDSPDSVELTQPDGSLAPLTEYGRSQLARGSIFSAANISFDRGASRVWKIDLHRLFIFSRPGTYSLRVSQDFDYWNGTAEQFSKLSISGIGFRLLTNLR